MCLGHCVSQTLALSILTKIALTTFQLPGVKKKKETKPMIEGRGV